MKSIEEQTREAAIKHADKQQSLSGFGSYQDCIADFVKGAEYERERAKKLLESPCVECEVGEMKQKGYTSPSGLTTYECDRCGHEETYP